MDLTISYVSIKDNIYIYLKIKQKQFLKRVHGYICVVRNQKKRTENNKSKNIRQT